MRTVMVFLIAALTGCAGQNDVFDLKVERIRFGRNQAGTLHIDLHGLSFRSNDGKTDISIAMEDLREAAVADPRSLRFQAYDVRKWNPVERQEYTFRAEPDAPVEGLARFFAARLARPVVGHYGAGARFRVGAFHRQIRGGTQGMLEIGDDSIRFVSDRQADSRTWRYRDIETIGRPDAYRFRVTTTRETYVVELKSLLPEAAYQFAWGKVYGP